MPSKQISDIETQCINAIKTNDMVSFELLFNMYMTQKPKTADTIYIKSYMLLYLLSCDRIKEYYHLVQTMTLDDLESPMFQFVLSVYRNLHIGSLNKLGGIIEKCRFKGFETVLGRLYQNAKMMMQVEEERHIEEEKVTREADLNMIQDALFIAKNSSSL